MLLNFAAALPKDRASLFPCRWYGFVSPSSSAQLTAGGQVLVRYAIAALCRFVEKPSVIFERRRGWRAGVPGETFWSAYWSICQQMEGNRHQGLAWKLARSAESKSSPMRSSNFKSIVAPVYNLSTYTPCNGVTSSRQGLRQAERIHLLIFSVACVLRRNLNLQDLTRIMHCTRCACSSIHLCRY